MPLSIDDLVFGISAAAFATVVAVTHGGSQPLFEARAVPAVPAIADAQPLALPTESNESNPATVPAATTVALPAASPAADTTTVAPAPAAELPATIRRHESEDEHDFEREFEDD